MRDAILRISADNLTKNGVAYVSYNVYPGWQLRGVICDMVIYHAGTEGDPRVRVAKAPGCSTQSPRPRPGPSPTDAS